MTAQTRIEAACFPAGLFSPVPEGHTPQSALATSLALLRLCAGMIERNGGSAKAIRQHIADVEHLT